MIFDFDRFTISIKLAYRRCEECLYTLEDVLHVFKYYFETYEYILGKEHPAIRLNQIAGIIDKMPYLSRETVGNGGAPDILPEDHERMIDQHFNTKYNNGKCDYNINHFFSGQIRELRYHETLY